MPEGLAPVTTRPATRTGRARGLRRLARPLTGVVLMMAGVVAPIESADLPDPLRHSLGSAEALAQDGPVTDGRPDPCPSDPEPWAVSNTDASVCLLEIEPCSATPWDSSVFLDLSVRYIDFCEKTFQMSDDADVFVLCLDAPAFAVITDGTTECTILKPRFCPAGVRVSPILCRAVQRRGWQCDEDKIPRNEFNSCYEPHVMRPPSPHPACGEGAPSFEILECRDYVDIDFVQDPDAVTCTSFVPSGSTFRIEDNNLIAGVSQNYWCKFDASLLNMDCHPSMSGCTESEALCLKRASETGGCTAIANTIRCRALQAQYKTVHDKHTRGEAGIQELNQQLLLVRDAGCEPCVVLPFEGTPDYCPEDLTDEPTQERLSGTARFYHRALLTEEQDIALANRNCVPVVGGERWDSDRRSWTRFPGGAPLKDHQLCAALPSGCPDPSPGRLTWSSSHSLTVGCCQCSAGCERS